MTDTPSGENTLPTLSAPVRTLFTGFLLVMAVGLLMAGGQILLTHGAADGKFGLSVDDVVYSYYGNRGDSRMEAKLSGSMKGMAPPEDRLKIVKWVRDGSPEAAWATEMAPVFQKNCGSCHGASGGLPPLVSYETVTKFTKVDTGTTVSSLARVSHVHLFGIAFIFVFVCGIFSMAVGIPKWLQCTAIAAPFAFLIVDVFSWWMTKWAPGFAYLTILAGSGYAISSGYMILTSLYQMWILPRRTAKSS